MKVCRMCWALIDSQLDTCNCITSIPDGLNFKDVAEAINHFVNHEKLMSKRSRKLLQLVEEWLEETKQPIPEGHVPLISLRGLTTKIQSLLDKSKRNK